MLRAKVSILIMMEMWVQDPGGRQAEVQKCKQKWYKIGTCLQEIWRRLTAVNVGASLEPQARLQPCAGWMVERVNGWFHQLLVKNTNREAERPAGQITVEEETERARLGLRSQGEQVAERGPWPRRLGSKVTSTVRPGYDSVPFPAGPSRSSLSTVD